MMEVWGFVHMVEHMYRLVFEFSSQPHEEDLNLLGCPAMHSREEGHGDALQAHEELF